MPILYIMCGPPGCGKTTYVKNSAILAHCVYVSRDKIRFSILKEDEENFAHENEVYALFIQILATNLMKGYDVVADATHLNPASRAKLIKALDHYTKQYKIICIGFNTDIHTCLKQNAMREGRARVPNTVIENMYRKFVFPTRYEDDRIIDIIEVRE